MIMFTKMPFTSTIKFINAGLYDIIEPLQQQQTTQLQQLK